jgi:hypothetical protein
MRLGRIPLRLPSRASLRRKSVNGRASTTSGPCRLS